MFELPPLVPIVDKLVRTSPSQIQSHALCPRRWWFQTICGQREPSSPAQELGTALHAEQEAYYLTGAPLKHPSLIKLHDGKGMPKPGPDLLIEQPRDYGLGLAAAGIAVRGRIDLRRPGQVIDLKSSSTLNFVKTPEELATNPQMVTYGTYACANGDSSVVLTHAYVSTGTPDATVVSTDPLTEEQILDTYQDVVVKPVEAMKVAALAQTFEAVEPNRKACWSYGRACPFLPYCDAEVITQGPTMTIREKLAQRAPATPEYAINPPDAAKPAEAVTYVPAPAPPAGDLVLFIDCQPIRGYTGITYLEDEIERRSAPIAKANGKEDLRQVHFNAGIGELAASFRREPLRGLVVASATGFSGQVLEILIPQAAQVVRGRL